MKAFEYNYDIIYGNGQGIIFAESHDEAMKLFNSTCSKDTSFASQCPNFNIVEINITIPKILDYSWVE